MVILRQCFLLEACAMKCGEAGGLFLRMLAVTWQRPGFLCGLLLLRSSSRTRLVLLLDPSVDYPSGDKHLRASIDWLHKVTKQARIEQFRVDRA